VWQTSRVAEVLAAESGLPIQVIGWRHTRHCGCAGLIGMRLDNREDTFTVQPCDEHGAQVRRALDSLKNMPPQDEPIAQLFKRMLEHEIADPTTGGNDG
jgi:hypothetical protein